MTLKLGTGDRLLEPLKPAGKAGRWCLPASLGAHVAALALMVGLVGETAQLKGENEVPVDVDIITVSEWTSPDSSPSEGQDGGEEVSEVEPLEVAEPKPVEMAALDPLEEIEPLALEASDSPNATELEAADDPKAAETTVAKPVELAQRLEPDEAAPVPAAEVEEPKQALPLLATRNEMEEAASPAEELAGEDAATALPTELKTEETPEALPTKVAELTPSVQPRELTPLADEAEAEEPVKPLPKPERKEKREEKKTAKKEVKTTKTAEKAREGKTKKKVQAALARGTDSEASTSSRSRSSGSASMSNYLGQIAARLQRQKRYPEEARRKRARGTVRISFTINSSGRVTGSRLVGSSGEPSLDKEVRAMLSRAAPFPPIPDSVGRNSLSITVPIRFSMN